MGGNVNFEGPKKPVGEMAYKVNGQLEKKTTKLQELFGTEAGQKAIELDKADGKFDGKISASVWNAYAKDHGGNEVKEYISIGDAMDSITTYLVREEQEAHEVIISQKQQEALERFQALGDKEAKPSEPQFGLE